MASSNSVDMSLSQFQEMVKDSEACNALWGFEQSDVTEQVNNNKKRLRDTAAQWNAQNLTGSWA